MGDCPSGNPPLWLLIIAFVFWRNKYSSSVYFSARHLIDGLRETHPKYKNVVFRVWACDKPTPVA